LHPNLKNNPRENTTRARAREAQDSLFGDDEPEHATTDLLTDEVMDALFDAFWQTYPRKVGKQRARAVYRTRLRDGTPPTDLLDAARSYARSKHGTPERFIMHPATFLFGTEGPWREELEPPDPFDGLDVFDRRCLATEEELDAMYGPIQGGA
jgi:hypothetical protein